MICNKNKIIEKFEETLEAINLKIYSPYEEYMMINFFYKDLKILKIILKYVVEQKLGYTEDTVKKLDNLDFLDEFHLERLKKIGSVHNIIPKLWGEELQVEDLVDFIYPKTYTIEERVKKTYSSYLNNNKKVPKEFLSIKNYGREYKSVMYFCLETLLEYYKVDLDDDAQLKDVLKKDFFEKHGLGECYSTFYTTRTEMLLDLFNINIKKKEVKKRRRKKIKKECMPKVV